jgi:Tol biopolymer transport system component
MTEFPKTQLVWLDQSGRDLGPSGEPGEIFQARLSPDGQRAALTTGDPLIGSSDLWLQDLTRNTLTRFVTGDTDDGGPVWSPDGSKIAYFSCCQDTSTLHIKDTHDSSKAQVPITEQPFIGPFDWSSDGRFLLYRDGNDVWVLPLSGGAKPYSLIKGISGLSEARFSTDGRWVAFVSTETGREEVYVTRFDRPDEKWRVSTNGGSAPRWRHNAAEIFYRSADLRLMTAKINSSEKVEVSTPEQLFKVDPLSFDYDVAPDGKRFLFVTAAPGTQSIPFTVILNWTADLKK